MSYSLSLYRFSDGELAAPDLQVVRAVLSPVRAGAEKTGDGTTDYIVELTDRLGAGILLPSGAFLCPEGMRAHLPEGMEDDSVLVPAITLSAFERAAGPFTEPLT
ncbi:hypothetical protein ACGF5T_12230 [Streptomyces sp. NPDC047853]|uniref:hypothetical protein n=1 Tax=unclassified Streptomyces TaxID=2593676 RepID=UPI0034517DCE